MCVLRAASCQTRQAEKYRCSQGEFTNCQFTKSVGADDIARDTKTVLALVLVDSVTNFVGCVPVRSKSQTDLTVREFLQCTQVFGHVGCT